MNKLTSATKNHPVIAFYILAFAISWLGWIPLTLYNRGISSFNSPLLNFIAVGGPTFAAVIVIILIKEKGGFKKLFGALLKLRISFGWYVFVFGFWIIVAAIAIGIGAIFGLKLPSLGQFGWIGLFPIFILMLLFNVWEEIGWRGFALPRLQNSFSDLKIVFIMGPLWCLWHLPLLLDPTSSMSRVPWNGFIITELSATVIFTWLYEHTSGSLFFVSVFHAMSNTMAYVLLQLGIYEATYLPFVGVTTAFAIAILLADGSQRFIKTPFTSEEANNSPT
jgi:membrane protease YdiL (CAAX protease family)